MSVNLDQEVTQFMRATTTYKAWVDCGKDFVLHEHLFAEWDFECKEYMRETGLNRMQVINQIWKALGW